MYCSAPLEVRFTHIWRYQRRRQCRRHSDAIKALLCSAFQGVSPTTLRHQSRRFRRRVSGTLMRRAAAAASDAVPRGRFRRTGARWCAFQARYWCALQARWWLAGGALVARASGAPSSAVSGEGRCWAPLGAIAGVVSRHLHASLGRVKGATAVLLGRFISAIGGALERGRYRRH